MFRRTPSQGLSARRLLWSAAVIVALNCFVSSTAAAQALSAPWSSIDIGNPPIAGSASESSGRFTIEASGADIWGTSDQFHFLYQQVTGDVDVRARIDSVVNVDAWSKAGVMIRTSLQPGAAHAYALASAGKGLAFQRRRSSGGYSYHTRAGLVAPPRWTRLVRTGTTVTAYVSADGVTWTRVASDTIALGATAYVGIAVTSHASALTTAQVSQVTVSPVGLPAGYQTADVGGPTPQGSGTSSAGTFTLRGAGADIWGSQDEFRFVYTQVTGDVELRARVASLQYVNSWTKAGVMIRETLAANSRHGTSLVSSGRGYAFQRRPDTGGLSENTAGGSGAAPGWVRLVRTGTNVDAYRSTDGVTWTLIGSDTIPMAASVYVGLVVSSHVDGTLAQGVFDNVSIVQQGGSTNTPPTVSLSAPASGSTFTAPASTTVSATASDTDGQVTRVDFLANNALIGSDTTSPYSIAWSSIAAGSYSLTAVAYDNTGASTTSAARTITVSAGTNQPPTVTLSAPANGATFTAPATITVSATASDPENSMSRVDFFANGTQIGTDSTAPYSISWANVAAGSYSVTAVARDAAGNSATSAASGITVKAATTNQPPTVSITSPANGATFAAPATLTISASASDPEGALSRVDFYGNGTLVSSDTTAPYSVSVPNVPAGSYSLTAIARDAAGNATTSAAVNITVGSTTNAPPTVSLTSPANGATFTAPATITVSANASDPEGAMSRVDFYANGTQIGTDSTAPYSISWSSVAAGTYSVTAVARDAAGNATTSGAASVTVSGSTGGTSWVAAFTASPDQATVTRYVLEVFASGANPATATPVATSDLGKPTPNASNEISVDRTTFFTGLAAGTYIATVKAESSSGFSRSAAVSFTR